MMVMRARVHRRIGPVAAGAAAAITIRRRRKAILGGFLLTIAALWIATPVRGPSQDTPVAVPDLDRRGPATGLLLGQGEPPGSEQRLQQDRQAPFDALEQALKNARTKLEELTEATATLAAGTELTDEMLAEQIRRNEQLEKIVSRADAARMAAMAEVEKTHAEMARQLKAATNAATQSRADLAGFYQELEAKDKELANAKIAREEVGAWVFQLEEEVFKRSAANIEHLKTELAAVKAKLGRAAGAAVEAERARQAMSNEAELPRSEAARARDELSAAKTETVNTQPRSWAP
jgi:DNA repair exonuclease SbcCD ATPase subunit